LWRQAQVLQWLNYAESELLPHIAAWIYPFAGLPLPDPSVSLSAKKPALDALKKLDSTLLTRTFLVGERLSLGDLAVFSVLLPLYQIALDPATRKPFDNVNRWFHTVSLRN